MKPEGILNILMRTDMASLNAGKAMAQAAHAANAMDKDIYQYAAGSNIRKMYTAWKAETSQGFGTPIVRGASWEDFAKALDLCHLTLPIDESYHHGAVIDPTYPLKDGDVTHLIELPTCLYVFCQRDGMMCQLLHAFPLHP